MAENGVTDSISNLSEEEMYKFGLTFFKENEGRNFHLAYQDKIDIVAFTQQANHGNLKEANLPPLGTLDIIGKERRAAWEKLEGFSKEKAQKEFIDFLLKKAPGFQDFLKGGHQYKYATLYTEPDLCLVLVIIIGSAIKSFY